MEPTETILTSMCVENHRRDMEAIQRILTSLALELFRRDVPGAAIHLALRRAVHAGIPDGEQNERMVSDALLAAYQQINGVAYSDATAPEGPGLSWTMRPAARV